MPELSRFDSHCLWVFSRTHILRAVAEDATDLETPDPPIDLEMFEVQFVERENCSSNRTGSGSRVGRHPVASNTNSDPTIAASTSTISNLELSIDADAEEKTALSCSDTLMLGLACCRHCDFPSRIGYAYCV